MKKKLAMLAALAVVASSACAAPADDDDAVAGEDAMSTAHVQRHAIVLAHGFDGSLTNRWSFYKVADTLRNTDHQVVHAAQVSPYKGVPARAAELARHVDDAQRECRAIKGCDATKVHIIAHSMGGLDARYMISKLGYGDRVASLVTISTPHRGSRIADVLLNFIPDDLDKAVSALASVWGRTFTPRDLADGSDLKAALTSISEKDTAVTFAPEAMKDDPRVTYLSWAGVSNFMGLPNSKDYSACEGHIETHLGIRDGMDGSLVPAAWFVAHGNEGRPNDGMVTVASAKWGKFMGCIPADHLDEVGQPNDGVHWFTRFNHLTFYSKVASSLDDEVSAHAQASGTR